MGHSHNASVSLHFSYNNTAPVTAVGPELVCFSWDNDSTELIGRFRVKVGLDPSCMTARSIPRIIIAAPTKCAQRYLNRTGITVMVIIRVEGYVLTQYRWWRKAQEATIVTW